MSPESSGRKLGTQLAIIVGVLLLVGFVLALKAQQASVGSMSSQQEPRLASPVRASPTPVTVSSAQTDVPAQPLPTSVLLPEAQLEQLLAEGTPALAFFHSTTCDQCIRMTEIVNKVYPEFATTVALVDVNVYDQRNAHLLQQAGIRVIPTLVFIDHTGQGKGYTGVMQPDVLREQLRALARE